MYNDDSDREKTELEKIQERLDQNYSQSASHPADPWDAPTVNPELLYTPQPTPAIARPVEKSREQELEDLVVEQQKELAMYKDLQAKRSQQQRERKAMAERQKSNIVTWAIIAVTGTALGYAAYNRFSKPEPPLKVQEPVATQSAAPTPSPSPTFTPSPEPTATTQTQEQAIAPSPSPSVAQSPSMPVQPLTVNFNEHCSADGKCILAAVMKEPSIYSQPIGGLRSGIQIIPTGQTAVDRDDTTAKWVQFTEYTAPDGTTFKDVWVSECYVDSNCTRSRIM